MAALLGFVLAARGNQLAFPALTLAAGGSVAYPLQFVPSPEPVVAFQFDVEYDAAALALAATPGEALRESGKQLFLTQLAPGRTRFLVAGWNQNAVPSGPLIQFLAAAAAGGQGQTHEVKLANALAIFPNGGRAPLEVLDGRISVGGAEAEPLTEGGVLNGASLAPGAVAPGEIVTLLGSGIGPAEESQPAGGAPSSLELGGVSVWFAGRPAPLLYAAPGQINAVVPWGVSGSAAEVAVRRQGRTAASTQVRVAAAAPAVFTLSATGVGPGAILNGDGSVNSPERPARRLDAVSIFATGSGLLSPAGADGEMAVLDRQVPVLPLFVRIGGRPAEVLYAGAAPLLVSGVLQVNCVIPASVEPGDAVAVELQVGEFTSPAGATIAIR